MNYYLSTGLRALLLSCLFLGVSSFTILQPGISTTTPRDLSRRAAATNPLFDPSTTDTSHAFTPSTTLHQSAVTLDPTTFLSDIFGGLMSSDAILLVPIFAALAVGGTIAAFITLYSNPQVEEDDE